MEIKVNKNLPTWKKLLISILYGATGFFLCSLVLLIILAILIPKLEQGALIVVLTGPLGGIYGFLAGFLLYNKSFQISNFKAIIGGILGIYIGTGISFLSIFNQFLGFQIFILPILFCIIGHLIGLKIKSKPKKQINKTK